mmetsp:Transcript_14633/g.22687  ORF Transcript_14633/g.22687 Transcript_14633/m.22687 type:complete len:97 (+) Transcript_14633:1833-2123(+)
MLSSPSFFLNKIGDKIENDDIVPEVKEPVPRPVATKCTCHRSPLLIVDDLSFNSQTLNLMIKESFKIQADVANNGLEALEMFKMNLKSYLYDEIIC